MDGQTHDIGRWDMLIAHPPCTYLTVTGNRWLNVERYGEKAIQRKKDREDAIRFFMAFVNADCDKIAIENPVCVMSTVYRKPNQIIHPYMFGDPERKGTCLWLKGLPKLKPTNIVEPNIIAYKNGKGTDPLWHMNTSGLPKQERAKLRSKTFPGIARAMADRTGLSTAMTGRTFDGAFTATVLTNGTTTAMTVFTSGFTNSIDTVKTDDLTREGF